jgi:hypothetical protein
LTVLRTIKKKGEGAIQRILADVVAFSVFVVGLLSGSVSHAESDFKVALLGTGSPAPRADRFGPSTLVEAGDQKLLFDAGRGVPIRLRQINVPLGKINILFITHYHSDHTSGIPDVWLTGFRRFSGVGTRRSMLSVPLGQRRADV